MKQLNIDREEFLKFVAYFGSDDDTLAFRSVHDKLSYEETKARFNWSNSINSNFLKKDIEDGIDILEIYNKKGYAIHILPNLAHKKEEQESIIAFPIDYDCGKEQHDVNYGQEAIFEEYLSKRDDVLSFIKKELKTKAVYTVFLTKDEISKRKDAFLAKHKKVLEYALLNESPNGFRGIYFLDQAIPYNEAQYASIQAAIIKYLGTDEAFMKPTQPLRSSGFYHQKGEAEMVKTIQLPKRKITLSDLEEWFAVDYSITKLKADKKEKMKEKAPLANAINPIPKSPRPTENGFITYEEALEEIKNRPFSDFFDEIEDDNKLFSCLFHSDEKPSSNIYHSTYKCFSCNYTGNAIQLWLDLYYGGNTEQLRAAVVDMMERVGYEIQDSAFYTSQVMKYHRNSKWIASVGKEISETSILMSVQYPNLYKKFFKQTIVYEKPGKEYKFDKAGNKIVDKIYTNGRFLFLKQLLTTAADNCRDIEFNGHAIFFVSQRHLAKQFALVKGFSPSKADSYLKMINQYLKQFELLGFIHTVDFNDVPEKVRQKALVNKKEDYETINFYTMCEFEKNARHFEEKAHRLSASSFNNRKHTSARGLALHQGEESAKEIYKKSRNVDTKWTVEEQALIRFIQKELDQQGYVFVNDIRKKQINYKGVKPNGTKGTIAIHKRRKEELLPLVLQGVNGIINTMDLDYTRSSKKYAEHFGYDAKDYRNQSLIIKKQGLSNQ